MKILKLILVGYKRLSLKNINYFKYEPEQDIQLIIGSNGTGKSSILKELTPLPALKNEFKDDGYKFIVIEKDKNLYELKSSFINNKKIYSYIKDGVELNNNGNITTFKDLVKKDFNITQDIHNLMYGGSTFHNITMLERRNWFTMLSVSDYTYAINYYNKLKEQLRDVKGAIKINKSKLSQELNKLLNKEEINDYIKEINEYNELLDKFIELKSYSRDLSSINKDIRKNEYSIKTLTKDIFNNIKNIDNNKFKSLDEIKQNITFEELSIDYLNKDIKSISEGINYNEQLLKISEKNNITDITELDEHINKLNNNIKKQESSKILNIDVDSPDLFLFQVIETLPIINDLTSNMPEVKYSKEEISESKELYTILINKERKLENDLTYLKSKIKDLLHIKDHNITTCPKCSHIWSKGYNQDSYDEFNNNIKKIEKILSSILEDKLILKETIESMDEYNECLNGLRNMIRTRPFLKVFWDKLLSTDWLDIKYNKASVMLFDFKTDLELDIQIRSNKLKLKESNNLISVMSSNTDISNIKSTIIDLNKELLDKLTKIKTSQELIKRYKNNKDLTVSIFDFKTDLEFNLKKQKDYFSELKNNEKQSKINDIIKFIRLNISDKENIVSNSNTQQEIINNISSGLNDLNDRDVVLKAMIKEISPTEGLIAKGLSNFINNFVFKVNDFISNVWLYKLELIYIEDNNLDLDFKFEVKIGEDNISPDISKTSSSIKEIINLAFKITSMEYMGLENYPIYLDEIGASFDKEHRTSIYKLIQNLLDRTNFSQIFIVSHYETMYNSFRNSDITMLCENNVNAPVSDYNTVCTMK